MREREPRRDRDLQDYTDRFGREHEPRLSRADEQAFADEAEATRQRELERERAERDARIERKAMHTLQAVAQLRDELRGDDRPEVRTLDDRVRRLAGAVRALRPKQ